MNVNLTHIHPLSLFLWICKAWLRKKRKSSPRIGLFTPHDVSSFLATYLIHIPIPNERKHVAITDAYCIVMLATFHIHQVNYLINCMLVRRINPHRQQISTRSSVDCNSRYIIYTSMFQQTIGYVMSPMFGEWA